MPVHRESVSKWELFNLAGALGQQVREQILEKITLPAEITHMAGLAVGLYQKKTEFYKNHFSDSHR